MNRHPSTISRELRRNRGQRGYRPKQAQALSEARIRACSNGPRIPDETWAVVDVWLGELWSPEQITGRLDERGLPSVSHEAIYRRIYADKRNGGTLHRALRCQKARRKRYGGRERRGTIPNQVSIEQRPARATGVRAFDQGVAVAERCLRRHGLCCRSPVLLGASSNLKCNFENRKGGRDEITSEPPRPPSQSCLECTNISPKTNDTKSPYYGRLESGRTKLRRS